MPCIHGLDEINCPTCRISNSVLPKTDLVRDNTNNDFLKPMNPHFVKYVKLNAEFENTVKISQDHFKFNLIKPIPTPKLINDIPQFENQFFNKQYSELKIESFDNFQVVKKTELGKSEIELEKE